MSEEVRDELTRPLRVESGQTSSPGADPSRRQPDHRELRQGGPRLPELDEELAEGVGEPRTIEKPRKRARFVGQGVGARPLGEARRHAPTPPPSPGETRPGRRRFRRRRHLPKVKRSRGHNRRRGIRNDCRGSLVTPGRRARERDEPRARPDGRRKGLWDRSRAGAHEAYPCTYVRLRQDEAAGEANVDVFAAAAAPGPPVCFGADAAPSLAARDGAAAASAPRSTALQQRAVQSGYRHDSWQVGR